MERTIKPFFSFEIGYTGIVQFLVQNGADANEKDGFGRTPLLHAERHGNSTNILLKSQIIYKIIIKYFKIGHTATVQFLTQICADDNDRDAST